MSESQSKSTAGRKPKYDYKSEEFLAQVESYAKKGFADKEIACALGIAPQTFSDRKAELSELSECLQRARAGVTAVVRAKFLAMGLGGIKTKSTTRRRLKDKDGNVIPNLSALATWLQHYDPEWRRVQRGEEPIEETDDGS